MILLGKIFLCHLQAYLKDIRSFISDYNKASHIFGGFPGAYKSYVLGWRHGSSSGAPACKHKVLSSNPSTGKKNPKNIYNVVC
jgi:hypothetical protein